MQFIVSSTLRRNSVSIEEWLQVLLSNKNSSQIEISIKYILYVQFVVASAPLRIRVSIDEWLAATTFVK